MAAEFDAGPLPGAVEVHLERGVAVPIPGTPLEVTLIDSLYGEKVVPDDAGPTGVTAVVTLEIRARDGKAQIVEWIGPHIPNEAFGYVWLATVGLSEVFLKVWSP